MIPDNQTLPPNPQKRYPVRILTQLHGRHFIAVCFSTLLGRPPEDAAMAHFVNLLRSGTHKTEIIARIRFSREGRAFGALVPGLTLRVIWLAILKLPIIGYMVETISLLPRLATIARRVREIEATVFDRDPF